MGIDITNKPCEAMAKAGIQSAGTQEGIDFCYTACPYTYCVVCERGKNGNRPQLIACANRKKAREMRFRKVRVDEIAVHLGRSRSSVWGYLADTSP